MQTKSTLKIRFDFDAIECAPRTQWAHFSWCKNVKHEEIDELSHGEGLFAFFFLVLINCTQIEYVMRDSPGVGN